MPVISMKQLLEAGVHFGHQTRKWNPLMKKYIFTARNDIHILNLEQTSDLIDAAYNYVRDVAASGNNRWLGGCLTNFKTIKTRIERLNKLNQMEKVGEFNLLPKKEVARLKQERDKLEANLGGIKDMRELPGLIFVVDPTKEHICVKEAKALGIPLVGLVDTNCDPSNIDYVIPGNDDAIRSVKLIASAIADAIIEAREGVSMKTVENEEGATDMAAALTDDKALEEAKAEEEVVEKKPARKPRAKKVETPKEGE